MVEKYEQVLGQDPASTVFVELAKALIERGEHSRAIEVCQGGLSHHPNSVIGRVLWGEFFNNRDWPVASAVAIAMLVILVVPIMILRGAQARTEES